MEKEIPEVRLKGNCADTPGGVLHLGGAQSYGIYRLRIQADESRQGLAIAATFGCGSASAVTVVPGADGLLDVPAEATASATTFQPGIITFWGTDGDAVRLVSAKLSYRVLPTGSISGGNAIPPTPEVTEQLLAQLDAKLDAPRNTGTSGQVPVLQADGSTLWQTAAGGTVLANVERVDHSTAAGTWTAGARYTVSPGQTVTYRVRAGVDINRSTESGINGS